MKFLLQKIKLFTALILIGFSFTSFASNQIRIDSLTTLLQITRDSNRIPILLSLTWDLRNSKPENSIECGLEAIDLTGRFRDYENLAKAHSFVGAALRVKGNYSRAIDYYSKGLEIAKQFGVVEQEGFAYLNLASIHIYQEHFASAIENVKKAEEIAKKIDNKAMLAYAYIYYGSAYQFEKEFDIALNYYNNSLSIRKETNNISGQGTCYKHIGDVYFAKGQYSEAIENYDRSIELFNEKNDNLLADILVKKSLILLSEKKLNQASELAYQGLDMAHKVGAKLVVRDALQALANISLITNDYKSASSYFRNIILYNDTLFSQKLSEKILNIEYQSEKKLREAEIELMNKDYAIKELEVNRIRIFSITLSIILVLLAGISIGVLFLLRVRRQRTKLLEKQNQEIIDQRNSIEQKNKRLNEANEKLALSENNLKKLVKTKDKLFSIIAHDLRSPFIAMVGLTEVLQQKAPQLQPSEVSQYAFYINESSQRLLNLIDNLLHWSRSQTGKLTIVPKKIPVRNLADDVFNVMRTQADSKKITLENRIADNISIFADYNSISTVIRNLVSNAIKFSNENGTVTLNAQQHDGSIHISIADNGVGVDPENMDKLFKIEENFTTRGTHQEAGTGLGLIICKEFVEKNGGSIVVNSKVGKGTIFTITLPENPR